MSLYTRNILSEVIIPVKTTDTVADVNHLFASISIKQLPVISSENEYLGILNDAEITEYDPKDVLNNIPGLLDLVNVHRAAIFHDKHPIEALKLFGETNNFILPVIDSKQQYLGCISYRSMLLELTENASNQLPGAILVLQMQHRDYSLGHLAQILEQEDYKILHSNISSGINSDTLQLTLKLNRLDVQNAINTLERFGFTIAESYTDKNEANPLHDRYSLLMHYLELI
jgi:acetoin utilization protein AcuB